MEATLIRPFSFDYTLTSTKYKGYFKNKAYERESTSQSDLMNRFVRDCKSVTPTMLHNEQEEFASLVRFCISSLGSQKKNLERNDQCNWKNETVQENNDLRLWKFDATAKTIRNCFKIGGFSNQTDDSDSDDEDDILADWEKKWKTVEGNGRITDDATLSDLLEVDAELLTASYPTDEEILKS
ncbi:hypothetical protein AVEN_138324-1 [Araneus ventricosus]|uniref:Uncharacterized protein n=1 Tax=Araneus ventricosus TaxID=182803 RepID=A0A4Y2IZY7_ARAVE|nr:hypothetical protein AVEN_138324-1 [Araneus ventricosus]